MLDSWVALDRFSPWKSTIPVPSGPDFGGVAVLALEALERSPGLDQRAVDCEVFVREQTLSLGLLHRPGEEALGDVVLDQARPILGEARVIEGTLLQIHVQEPAEQHVVVEHLAEQPIRAHRVQRNQQRRFEQSLRRDRRTAYRCVHRIEVRAHRGKHRVGLRLHPTQWMIGRDPLLD